MDTGAGRGGRVVTTVAVVGTAIVVAAVGSVLVAERPIEVLYDRWMIHNGPRRSSRCGWDASSCADGHGTAPGWCCWHSAPSPRCT